jgi:hypothetical protein
MIEWFNLLGNSLGFNPGPISYLASSLQPAPVVPPNSPANSTHEPSPVHFPPVQALNEGFCASHGHQQEKPHSCSDCSSWTKVQEGLAIFQGLVFELQKDLDDLRFRLEVLDGKGTQFLQILSSLHGSCHPSDVEPNAPRNEQSIRVPATHGYPEEEAALDTAPSLKATFRDAWPLYKPTN